MEKGVKEMADGIKKSPVMDPHADEYSIGMYVELYENLGVCTILEDGHVSGFYRKRDVNE